MLISRSLGLKLTATATVAAAFVLMYEATVMDFPRLIQAPSAAEEISLPDQASHLRFTATAYCKGTTTASGVNVRTGIAAADPDLLPVGSVIQVYRLGERYNGIYTIMDTGPAVQGRRGWSRSSVPSVRKTSRLASATAHASAFPVYVCPWKKARKSSYGPRNAAKTSSVASVAASGR